MIGLRSGGARRVAVNLRVAVVAALLAGTFLMEAGGIRWTRASEDGAVGEPSQAKDSRSARTPSDVSGAKEFIVTGARVVPVATEPIEGGSIWVREGKIHQVGKIEAGPDGGKIMTCVDGCALQIRDDMPILDVGPMWILPGLVDAGSVAAGQGSASAPREALGASGTELACAAIEGITSALVEPNAPPAAEGVVTGVSALVESSGSSGGPALLKSPAAVHVSLVAGSKGGASAASGGDGRTLAAAEAALRKALEGARAAKAAMGPASETAAPAKPAAGTSESRTAPDGAALAPVISGEIPLVVRANRQDEIRAALRLVDDYGIRLVIEQGAEAPSVAEELYRRRIPVLIGPLMGPSAAGTSMTERLDGPAKLAEAGVRVAFRSGSVRDLRDLPFIAGIAVAHGLSWDEAIRAITLTPAEIFGVEDRIGSIAIGTDANFLVATGDPLEITTRVERVCVRGTFVPAASRELELLKRYKN